MSGWRPALLAVLITAAVVAQSVLTRYLSIDGVVPNLALVVVVAIGIARGPEVAAVAGFCAGLLLDLAPPADHVAGRWALAFVVVGYLAGRVQRDARASAVTAVLVVGAASFVGTSIYALSGRILSDGAWAMDQLLQAIVISVLWDLMLAPFLIPALLWAVDAARPARVA